MARGESQGLQVAVILFTMLTVGLSVSTYMFYTSAEADKKRAADAFAAKKSAEDNMRKELYKIQAMRFMLGMQNVTLDDVNAAKGAGGDPEIDALMEEFTKTKSAQTPIGAADAVGMGFPSMIKPLSVASTERNKAITEASESLKAREDDVAKDRDTNAAKLKTVEGSLSAAKTDYDGEKEKFAADRADFEKKQNEIVAQLKAKEDQLKKLKDANEKEILELNGRIAQLEKEIKFARIEIKDTAGTGPNFEQPDGEITYVNQRSKVVWINLGYADGLQRQTTFTVWGRNVQHLEAPERKSNETEDDRIKRLQRNRERKGEIEVIKVVEPHLAECRIVTDISSNPILPQDRIFTPTWSPGRVMNFVLAGFIDIDNDNFDDREELKSIINANGGRVVGELTKDGKREEHVKPLPTPRYVIVGSAGGDGSSTGEDQKGYSETVIGSYKEFFRAKGVDVIELPKYLSQTGWKAPSRTTTLGRASTSGNDDKKRAPAPKEKTVPAEAPKKAAPKDDADPFAVP